MLCRNHGMVSSRSILLLLCLVVLGLSSNMCSADLSPADATALTGALETLTYSWDVTAMGIAQPIMLNPAYTATDLQTFFNQYFNTQGHPLTNMLWDFLRYMAFDWFTEADHLKLQTAYLTPFWTWITNFTAAHPTDLGVALYSDPLMHESMFNFHRFFACAGGDTHLTSTNRTTIFNNYTSYITTYPQYWSDATTIDVNAQPFVAQLRAQVWISFIDACSPLTSGNKTTVKDTIDLATGLKTTLWDTHTLLVIDNNGCSTAQLQAILDLRAAIPSALTNLRYITIRDFFHGPAGGGPIVRKGWNGGLNYVLRLNGSMLSLGFDQVGGGSSFVYSGSVPSGAWTHVAASYDGTTNPNSMKTYINGALSTTGTATGYPNAASTQQLTVGREIDGFTWFKGVLDEVKVYGRCLSGTEIADEYNLLPVSTSQLKGHWRMDETSGTLVADSSSYGNNGTNYSATIASGLVNNALMFNGSTSYVNVPDSASLRLSGAMTLEAWFYVVNEDVDWPTTRGTGCVNTFSNDIGVYQQNQFPPDISALEDDLFASGTLHEMNHIVNAYTVMNNPTFDARQDALIAQAGTVDLQYLRSQIGGAYFTTYPWEFFASISNEYMCSTQHTLDLAVQRFNAGYHEPINQFLFFADVYSQGTNTTKFYTVDTSAVVTVNDATLTRDGNGHINSLTYGGTTYNFTVDASGNVLSYTVTAPPPSYVGAGSVANGTGTASVPLPTGLATNDILLLFVETANETSTVSNQNGGTWTQVTNSPQGTGTAASTSATRLTVFWSRYNGTQGAPTISDSGNHQIGRIIAIRGATTSGNPWNITSGAVEATADTSASIPGVTTTVANTLVVTAIATALPDSTGTTNFSAWTNANLTSLTERVDNTTSSGNGGGIGIATGAKGTAGATGNTAVTCASNAYKGMMTIAIKP